VNIRQLGKTDIKVTGICLGTMQFGWTSDEAASFDVMDAYFEAGGNFIDTADIYSTWSPGNPGGVSEEIIGRWMKARGNRDKIIIATKLRGKMWDGPDGEGLGRAHIERAIEDSLRRLQVETIDLYQTHWPDKDVPVEQTQTVFGELIASGKVRYVGASNYSATQLGEALTVAEKDGLPPFVTLQPHYNLAHRSEFEAELAALCERDGIAVIPYSPLEGGFLTGKYRRGGALPRSQRAKMIMERATDQAFGVVDALAEIAEGHGATIAAVALAWLLAKPAITAPIIGANSREQLAELLPASDLLLGEAEIARLDRVSAGM
jgi:aryl-alcohol dehydrogenase-like predicted oxidoreductase